MRAHVIQAAAVALALGCSCGEKDEVSPAPDAGSGAGGTAGDGAVGAMGGTGAVGSDAASDADAATSFDCEHVQVIEDCSGGWCLIPPGCFVIGSPPDEWGRGAYTEDQVKVTLTRSFVIQQEETSQAQWAALVPNNPSAPPPKPGNAGDCLDATCPVGNVTWFEAAAFANLWSEKDGYSPCYTLGGCTGELGAGMTCTSIGTTAPTYYECEGYRLPGEAEWEYAARAGTTTAFYTGPIKVYPGDTWACNDDPNLQKAAWYCHNSKTLTHPGGLKQKNAWGLFDMLGNAAEWTNDPMKGLGYGKAPLVDPWGALTIKDPIEAIVLRGGAPIMPSSGCRAAEHFSVSRDSHAPGGGFRLVRTLLAPKDAGVSDAAPAEAGADASND